MLLKVTKLIAVIFMWIAFATQISTTAFASSVQVYTVSSPFPVSEMPDPISITHHAVLNENVYDFVDNAKCERGLREGVCCDRSADCSVLHCPTLSICLDFSFDLSEKVSSQRFFVKDFQVLVPKTSSLYRPPIFH